MKILSFEDWYDKYNDSYDYNDYVNDCEVEGIDAGEEDVFYEQQYETYISDYEDYAYEMEVDRRLFGDED